jgi:hypothetical protein
MAQVVEFYNWTFLVDTVVEWTYKLPEAGDYGVKATL